VDSPRKFFWAAGALSSFLDNAPTYLVFFNLAGGDPQVLMTTLASTLAAVSAGSVFMGANTYIGNAPNFMVKAIAEDRGIRMPSFFGYMAWSCGILIPLFVVMTNAPEAIHWSYHRYVANQLRKHFGFVGVPIRIRYKARRKAWRGKEGPDVEMTDKTS